MRRKRGVSVDWNHLNLWKIFDRGPPLMRVFIFAFLLICAGAFFSILDFLMWIGGFIMLVGVLTVALWLYLELS